MNEIYELINANLSKSINGIWKRNDNWYEVNYSIYNLAAYYLIVDGKILDVQFD